MTSYLNANSNSSTQPSQNSGDKKDGQKTTTPNPASHDAGKTQHSHGASNKSDSGNKNSTSHTDNKIHQDSKTSHDKASS